MLQALRIPKLPTPCAVCELWSPARLCADCLGRHAQPALRCVQCGLRIPSGTTRCGACIAQPPPFSRCIAAVDYAFPWSGLISRFKFRQGLDLASALSEVLVRAVQQQSDGQPAALVLPMPLSPERLRERGMNQAWELARRMCQSLGLPSDAHALHRVIDTPHLADLPREERARRIHGAFFVANIQAVQSQRIALVDDVLTTGATAAEATRTLLAAGATDVQLWVLARTPSH
jgi:ComF family protein